MRASPPQLETIVSSTARVSAAATAAAATPIKLSKKQQKRAKRQEYWLATKAERRKREKAQRKEKLAKRREAGETIVSRQQIRKQLVRMANSPCKVAIVIDCDYADYMTKEELKKLCKQLIRYGEEF